MSRITDEERRRLLVRRHGLDGGARSVEAAADALVGVHSTDPVSVYLAPAARRATASVHEMERALYDDRTLVRMLGMRRTLFVVPRRLVPAVQRGYTDGFVARERKRLARWLEQTGVADAGSRHIDRMARMVHEFLDTHQEASTREITSALPELDVRFTPPVGSATGTLSVGSRIVLLLTAAGELVRTRPLGSWISSQYRYTTAERWLGGPIEPMEPAQARAELAREWLRSYGPGTEVDLKWWTGWNLTQTRQALSAVGAVEVDLEAGGGYALADDVDVEEPDDQSTALLPALDSTPMGWKERDWYLGTHGARLFDRNGNVGPTVWWNGRIVGGWAQKSDGDIRIGLLETIPASAQRAIDDEANRLAAYVGDVRFTPRFSTPLERELSA